MKQLSKSVIKSSVINTFTKFVRHAYSIGKLNRFLFLLSLTIVFIFGMNTFSSNSNNNYAYSIQPTAQFIVNKPIVNQRPSHKNIKSENKGKAKSLRKQLKEEFRALKNIFKHKKNNTEPISGVKLLLIILTIYAALSLCIVPLFVAYILIENKNYDEGIFPIIMLLGCSAIFYYTVRIIKNILKKDFKKERSVHKKEEKET